ncbi:hypothetical protein LJY25_13320 [Hymenobacter sp. BT175]|uniref:hypothetical protein n=1 Tax=Hymenobacter translucens TaxID=2886507 RepID=UPI001D0EF20D|nr:hypothetical protein [Hymenobacter translucens]MCC2547429.1 hypothetical protein [Hymenobacter translucens]
MGKEISLFSGYSQPENRTTNYCQLVLRMLYEEHPKLLAEALSILCDGAVLPVGVQFRQQEVQGNSVPDGVIHQSGFTIYIETKHHANFDFDQLKRHMQALQQQSGTRVMLALGRFEEDPKAQFDAFRQQCDTDFGNQIQFAVASFETFLNAVRQSSLTPTLSAMVDDLEQYFNEMGLLPHWRGWLDVSNCSQFAGRLVQAQVYICPATGGAYSHSRCEYLGMYRDKAVRHIGVIRGVVDLYADDSTKVLWINDGTDKDTLIEEARQRFTDAYPGDTDWDARVFVLGPLADTHFYKDTHGGMRSSREYFSVRHLGATSIEDLAETLRQQSWSKLK